MFPSHLCLENTAINGAQGSLADSVLYASDIHTLLNYKNSKFISWSSNYDTFTLV